MAVLNGIIYLGLSCALGSHERISNLKYFVENASLYQSKVLSFEGTVVSLKGVEISERVFLQER